LPLISVGAAWRALLEKLYREVENHVIGMPRRMYCTQKGP
jgi:hypothetical protein